jgi:hypothetical protein
MGRGIDCIVTWALAVVKIISVLIFALFLPWLCVYYSQDDLPADRGPILGIEEFTHTMLTSMVPHDAACTFRSALVIDAKTYITAGHAHISLLREKGACVTTLFILDDGVSYVQQKPLPGITIIPIKKDRYDTIAGCNSAEFDCIMIDVQETGFVPYDGEPLLAVLALASKGKKPVIVFDRPNMLGASIEGFGMWLGSRALIPFRHGMTIGELAQFCNRHILETPVTLHVVQMKHYQRLAQDADRSHWVSQYCMQGFIDIMHEVKPFEVRVSADNKYHSIMLPVQISRSKRMWRALSAQLKRVGVEGKMYEYSNEATGQAYLGLNVSVQDVNAFSLNGALLTTLRFFSDVGLTFTYSERLRDMIGMHAIQSYLAGTVTEKEALDALEHEAQLFFSKALGSFLYQPLPKIMAS